MDQADDRQQREQGRQRVTPTVPLITLLLTLTAVPIEVRPFDLSMVIVSRKATDIVLNIAGYIPIGVVLAGLGLWRATAIATLISLVAETVQVSMVHRYPSPSDVVANAAGVVVGAWVARALRLKVPTLPLDSRTALAASVVVLALLGWAGHRPGIG